MLSVLMWATGGQQCGSEPIFLEVVSLP